MASDDVEYFQAFRMVNDNGMPIKSPSGKALYFRVLLSRGESKDVWIPKSLMKAKKPESDELWKRQTMGKEPIQIQVKKWFADKSIYGDEE